MTLRFALRALAPPANTPMLLHHGDGAPDAGPPP
jgi:hypothetical protein